jgi:hypothetical protein
MKLRTYLALSATVFAIVSLVHLSRLLLGWPMVMGSWSVPHWLSVPGLLFPGMLSIWGFRLARR